MAGSPVRRSVRGATITGRAVQAAAIVRTGPDPLWLRSDPAAEDGSHLLHDVTAISMSSAWAAGQATGRPLLQRWDDGGWTRVPAPATPDSAVGAALLGVDAVSSTTAIAVGGWYDRLAGAELPVALHWDGADWTAAPSLGRGYMLTAVATLERDVAWAVGHGFARRGGRAGAVAFRWDGSEWHPVRVPYGTEGRLYAVTVLGRRDVWAVGERVGRLRRWPMILHWNGRRWSRWSLPAADSSRPLTSLSAVTPDDIWAAGGGLLMHWDGATWSAVRSPVPAVNTVTARSATEVWVAGGHGELACFDGTGWAPVECPLGDAGWLGSAAAPGGPLLVVGSRRDDLG